jgi:hypothetical protein
VNRANDAKRSFHWALHASCFAIAGVLALAAHAADPSLDAARAARDKAKADLLKAQEAFDRADEAYIGALGGIAAAWPVTVTLAGAPAQSAPQTSGRPRMITFTLSGPRAQMVNPLEYRARVVVDGQPSAWTEHASGARTPVSPQAVAVAYEVQNDEKRDALNPAWRTICSGSLPPADTIVDVALAGQTSCTTR